MDREIDIDEPMSMLSHDDEEGEIQEKTDHGTSDHLHDSSLMLRNGHISLFGEIIHDTEPNITDDLRPPPPRKHVEVSDIHIYIHKNASMFNIFLHISPKNILRYYRVSQLTKMKYLRW